MIKLLQAPGLDEHLGERPVEEDTALCEGAACPRSKGRTVGQILCVLSSESESLGIGIQPVK